MKTVISILILVLGATGIVITRDAKEDHRTCSCSGTFCSCDATCLDYGEIPTCTCGVFSCICKCVPKDENNLNQSVTSLPSMNSDQESNSIKAEGYFRGQGNKPLADAIKTLRESIRSRDLQKYASTASWAESAFQALSQPQKDGWTIWSGNNLKK